MPTWSETINTEMSSAAAPGPDTVPGGGIDDPPSKPGGDSDPQGEDGQQPAQPPRAPFPCCCRRRPRSESGGSTTNLAANLAEKGKMLGVALPSSRFATAYENRSEIFSAGDSGDSDSDGERVYEPQQQQQRSLVVTGPENLFLQWLKARETGKNLEDFQSAFDEEERRSLGGLSPSFGMGRTMTAYSESCGASTPGGAPGGPGLMGIGGEIRDPGKNALLDTDPTDPENAILDTGPTQGLSPETAPAHPRALPESVKGVFTALRGCWSCRDFIKTLSYTGFQGAYLTEETREELLKELSEPVPGGVGDESARNETKEDRLSRFIREFIASGELIERVKSERAKILETGRFVKVPPPVGPRAPAAEKSPQIAVGNMGEQGQLARTTSTGSAVIPPMNSPLHGGSRQVSWESELTRGSTVSMDSDSEDEMLRNQGKKDRLLAIHEHSQDLLRRATGEEEAGNFGSGLGSGSPPGAGSKELPLKRTRTPQDAASPPGAGSKELPLKRTRTPQDAASPPGAGSKELPLKRTRTPQEHAARAKRDADLIEQIRLQIPADPISFSNFLEVDSDPDLDLDLGNPGIRGRPQDRPVPFEAVVEFNPPLPGPEDQNKKQNLLLDEAISTWILEYLLLYFNGVDYGCLRCLHFTDWDVGMAKGIMAGAIVSRNMDLFEYTLVGNVTYSGRFCGRLQEVKAEIAEVIGKPPDDTTTGGTGTSDSGASGGNFHLGVTLTDGETRNCGRIPVETGQASETSEIGTRYLLQRSRPAVETVRFRSKKSSKNKGGAGGAPRFRLPLATPLLDCRTIADQLWESGLFPYVGEEFRHCLVNSKFTKRRRKDAEGNVEGKLVTRTCGGRLLHEYFLSCKEDGVPSTLPALRSLSGGHASLILTGRYLSYLTSLFARFTDRQLGAAYVITLLRREELCRELGVFGGVVFCDCSGASAYKVTKALGQLKRLVRLGKEAGGEWLIGGIGYFVLYNLPLAAQAAWSLFSMRMGVATKRRVKSVAGRPTEEILQSVGVSREVFGALERLGACHTRLTKGGKW